MKKRLLQIVIVMMSLAIGQLNAQLTGIKTIPGDYPTIAAAVTDLNTQGVGAGGVLFNVAAGYTETAPVGGILLGSTLLNASVSNANQIVFQKSGAGANPLITAFTPGVSTTVDGIWKIQGTDYLTIDGIDLQENASNNTSTLQMEWGYALVKLSNVAPFDGCQNVIIRNSTITLNKANTNTIGIYAGNHIAGATTSLTITATTDATSNCKFYGNTITNCYGAFSLNGYSASTPFALYDQNNEIGVTSPNTITNFGGGSVSGRAIYGIYQNGIKVVGNNISSSVVGSTTTVYGVFLSTGTSSNADINNNTISLSLATGTFTSTVYGINNAMGSTAASNTININNNTFQNCDFSGFSSGNFYAIINGGTATTVNINNNIVNNITMAGTGSSSYVIEMGSPVTGNMNNNSITNITRTGTTGTLYGLKITSPTNLTATGNVVDGINYTNIAATGGTVYGFYGLSSAVNVTITNNIFRNFSTPTTGALYGIREFGSSGTKTIQNNQVYNFSTSSGGAGGASMYGIYCSTGNIEISSNQVYSLNSTGTTGGTGGTLAGIYVSGGTTNNIFKNKIYNISSNSTNPLTYGIYIGGGTTNNIHNNYVGDLRTPAANASIPLSGIYLSSGTTNNLYYNTVYLNATSTGALFGSNAIYASTTPTVLFQNNIFVNLSVPNGPTGFTSGYRRSSTTLTSYAAASNNNLFYAGLPCANRLIFYDGTNQDQTLAAFQTRVAPRDANSVTEEPPFLSTSGSSGNFLHINPAIPTVTESGGIPVAGITTDFDGDTRNASTPDIGADEFTGIIAVACTGIPTAGTAVATPATICANQSATICITGMTAATGISIQWQSSTTPGGPYTDITCAGSSCVNTGPLAIGTYYYIAIITCANSELSDTTNEVTVTVLGNPTVLVTPSSATACAGTPTTLTASGANTYAWSPATGLNTTSGDVVIATPAVTTTYTVTGANQAGCTGTAIVTITVLPVPTVTATANPYIICEGGSSQLQAIANICTQAKNYPFTEGSGTSLDPMMGATVVVGPYTDDAPMCTGGTSTSSCSTAGNSQLIGFDFVFDCQTYTYFSASPDGWIKLANSNAPATSSFSNSLAAPSNIPLISPYWDDLATGTDGNVQALLVGTAPNRILIIQWFVTIPRNTTGPANSTFQAWLNEGTNKIEYRYGPMGPSTTMSASIGLSGNTPASNFLSVSIGPPATASNTVANNSVTGQPAAGTIYTFTPATIISYAWSPSTFLNSTSIANPIATNVNVTTTYTATVIASNGCDATDTAKVTTYILTPTFTQLGPYCLNATPDILPSISLNDLTGTWSPSAISTSALGSTQYIFTPDPGQCAEPDTMWVQIIGPALTETHILPTSCLSGDGSIDLTVTGTGPYTYSWIGPNNYTANTQDISGLNGGFYYVTVTDGNMCQNTLIVNLDLNPSCLTCPVIGTLSANPAVICQGEQSTLTVSGLVGLGNTYGITFIWSATALTPTQLYGGSGTTIATVANANLGSNGSTATTNYTFNTAGNLFIYAILSPVPPDQSCRPVSTSSITVNPLPPLPIVQNITTCFGGSTLIVPSTTGGGSSTVSNTFTWDFEGGITGGGISQNPAIANNGPAQTVGAGITMITQGAGSGCTAAVSTSGYNIAPGNTLADAITSGDYIEFCVGSAIAPSSFNGVTAINWANRASGTGPINYVLVASNDLNTTLLSGTVLAGGTSCEPEGGNITLNAATCYRIYYYSATGSTGTLRIDNLVITASFTSPYSGGTFNFYTDPALTNLVAGPVASYNPQTTPTNSPQTIWVTQINTVTGCESAAVPVVITVYNVPTAEAGNNQFYCGLPASITISATSNYNGQWAQTGGAGTIVSPTSKTTTYNTNPADIGKTIVFTWTTFTPQGACPNVSDKMGLTTVRTTADAEFAYALDEYCPGSANPTVTHTTGVNGIYTYQVVNGGPSLALNRNTGEINMATSNEGTYNVTNTVDGRGNLIITGVVDGPLSGGLPKAIELYAVKAISDLSRYGLESANNGGGSAGIPEYTFPSQSVAAGTYIWVATESPQFTAFFGFAPTFINIVASINGDDAIVLYNDGQAIDVFGDVSYTANSFLPWRYEDGWAYRKNNTVNDGTVFNSNNWTYSGVNIWGTAATNATAAKPFPIKTFITNQPGGCANNTHTEMVIVGDLFDPVVDCPPNQGVTLDPGDCSAYVWYGDPEVSDNCSGDPVVTKISGPDKGTEFTLLGSPYTIVYEVYDANGNGPVTCSFTIAIHGFPNPLEGLLACNDTVQISLDANCEVLLNADMLLEGGPYKCYNQFEIYVNDPTYNGQNVNNIKIDLVPGVYEVTVADAAASYNSCKTTVIVMDKLPPVMECRDVTVTCYEGAESVTEPAPAVVGYQQIIKEGLNDVVEVNSFTYEFDFSYLPVGTPALDVNARILLTGHTYLPDLVIKLTAPDGTTGNIMTIGGCTGQEWPIDCWFDDDGASITQCTELNCGGCPLAPLQGGYSTPGLLTGFEGVDASGIWKITISDLYGGDDGIIQTVGLEVNVNLPQITPYDACGPIDLTFVDIETDFYCQNPSKKVVRTWTAVDQSGNSTSCVQNIDVLAPDLSTFEWPVNYDGLQQNKPMLECDANYPVDQHGNPDPAYTGYPGGISTCQMLEIFYSDDVHQLDCGIKILRKWAAVDDCSGLVYNHTQIIRITDTKLPTFCQPTSFRVPTKGYICNADVEIPALNCLEDNCCADVKWWITTNMNFPVTGDLNGNGFVDINENWVLKNIPTGIYELCYHAVDCCGNVAKYCIFVEVHDANPPVAVCEQFKTVSLTVSADARVSAVDFNSGSFDNCKPVFFKVLRVNNSNEYDGGCPGLNGDDNPKTATVDVWYDDEVFFCCPDAGNQVMVSMRVFEVDPGSGPVDPKRYLFGGDLYGRYNDCWSIVTVECKIPPTLTCPPVEITCEESLDPNVNTKLWPQVASICGYELSYTDARDNTVCSANITRTWTATSCTKSTQCKQSIKVIQSTPFDPCTIVFPSDKQVHCTSDLPDGGKPTWDEYPCNVVTAEIIREDTFKFVEGACYKILREWAVIDWCVYKANMGSESNVDQVTSARKLNCANLVRDGYYRYTQVLKIVDLIPPTITTVDQCVGFTDGCFANGVTMTATAADTCNTNEEFWWKYKVEDLSCNCEPIQVSYNYYPKPPTALVGKRSLDKLDKVKEAKLVMLSSLPEGHYKVTWTVGDGCGNANTSEQVFTVVDKKAPTPILVNIATATMEDCSVEVCAITFDKGGCDGDCVSSFDNCTPSKELYFTFGPMLPKLYIDPVKWQNQYNKYGRYFYDPVTGLISTEEKYLFGEAYAWDPIRKTTCRMFGKDREGNFPDLTHILEIYVWDQFAENEECDDNNYDFGVVVLSLNTDDDDCKPGSLVSGTIKTCANEKGINNVTVNFDDGEESRVAVTGSDGKFGIGLAANSYKVNASKKIDGTPGLTTLDLVIIQKHILGLKSINDACKIASMDMNSDGKVSATDILYGRKMLLGYLEAKSNYNFLNDQYIMENNGNPNISLKDAYTMQIDVEEGKVIDYVDFSGVLAGDVNNSAGAIENRNRASMVIDELELQKGETYEVPVYISDVKRISGTQFELECKNFIVTGIESEQVDLNSSNYHIKGSNVKFSWNGSADTDLNNEEPLFILKIEANENGHLGQSLSMANSRLEPEIYSENEISSIELKFRNTVGSFALHQNIPNPFSDKTIIGFDLPDSGEYSLSIYDITGKTIKVISANGKSGYNSVGVSKKELGSNGVFYYRLKAGDNTDTRKMIIIE